MTPTDFGVSRFKPHAFAFFDVDETLVIEKTMFTVLGALSERLPSLDAASLISHLQDLRRQGRSRAEVNRAFYRGLGGLPRNVVVSIARTYIQNRISESDRRPFFIPACVAQLKALRHQGVAPVFVSGSACDFLASIAEHLEVEYVLATRLQVSAAGRYTGEIDGRCMIGAGKAAAVAEFLAEHSVDPTQCFGFGDHPSDEPFISLLGAGAIVAGNPETERLARERNWVLIDNVLSSREVA